MELRDLILRIVEEGLGEIRSIICEVESVDESNRTCNLIPVDGSAKILKARLQPDTGKQSGFVQIPKEGSFVVASWISDTLAFVSLVTDPDKILIDTPEIIMNQGSNGGLVVNTKLQVEIEKLNANFTLIKNLITSAPVVPTDGGASFKAALIAGLNAIQSADLSGVTNDKIKH